MLLPGAARLPELGAASARSQTETKRRFWPKIRWKTPWGDQGSAETPTSSALRFESDPGWLCLHWRMPCCQWGHLSADETESRGGSACLQSCGVSLVHSQEEAVNPIDLAWFPSMWEHSAYAGCSDSVIWLQQGFPSFFHILCVFCKWSLSQTPSALAITHALSPAVCSVHPWQCSGLFLQ